MLKREAVDFDNEGLGIRGCCCVFGLWRVSCLGGSVYCTEDSTTTCRWSHKKTQSVNIHFQNCQDQWDAFVFIKNKKKKFLHFPVHSVFPGLHQKGCCIIVFGCCGPLAILTVAGNCQGAWHPSFPQPFLKEAVIHWVASCHLGSMSPTWHTSSWAISSVPLLLLLKQLPTDKRVCLAVQEQGRSLTGRAAHWLTIRTQFLCHF